MRGGGRASVAVDDRLELAVKLVGLPATLEASDARADIDMLHARRPLCHVHITVRLLEVPNGPNRKSHGLNSGSAWAWIRLLSRRTARISDPGGRVRSVGWLEA